MLGKGIIYKTFFVISFISLKSDEKQKKIIYNTFTERMVRLLEAGEFGLVYELILHIYFRMKTIF